MYVVFFSDHILVILQNDTKIIHTFNRGINFPGLEKNANCLKIKKVTVTETIFWWIRVPNLGWQCTQYVEWKGPLFGSFVGHKINYYVNVRLNWFFQFNPWVFLSERTTDTTALALAFCFFSTCVLRLPKQITVSSLNMQLLDPCRPIWESFCIQSFH